MTPGSSTTAVAASATPAAPWSSPGGEPQRCAVPWLLAGWGSSTAVTLLALLVAVWLPPLGLVLLLLTWPAEALVAWRAPAEYAEWG